MEKCELVKKIEKNMKELNYDINRAIYKFESGSGVEIKNIELKTKFRQEGQSKGSDDTVVEKITLKTENISVTIDTNVPNVPRPNK